MQQGTVANQILEVLKTHPECTLEELTQCLRDVDWLDVFLEVDRLSRFGQLRLSQSSLGLTTTLRVP
jgi:hypothetical protein